MNDSFVYAWVNHSTGRMYIGYHYGSPDDGYICSSMSTQFWNDFDNSNHSWSRTIVHHGAREDCIDLEELMLSEANREIIYNNNITGAVMFSDEIRSKISERTSGQGNGRYGRPPSAETVNQMVQSKRWLRPITCGNVTHDGFSRAVAETGLSATALKWRLTSPSFPNHVRIHRPKRINLRATTGRIRKPLTDRWSRPVTIGAITYRNTNTAARMVGVRRETIWKWCADPARSDCYKPKGQKQRRPARGEPSKS